jgi:transcriptional regulator with XRE-family HTH domain
MQRTEKYKLLGFNVARLRKNAKKSQLDVANYFDVTTRTISNWEHGKGLDVVLLTELAVLFGCKTEDFLMGINLSE